MKTFPSVPLRNSNCKNGLLIERNYKWLFSKNEKFLSTDFNYWIELSAPLMAARKLVQKIQVENATAQGGVAVALILAN